ncbi:hypothetical protein NESM_000014700 [Novymonas esmeraldas]|uniref:Uncharacterized protein n=1 Tax=Novymonas esmeraldas TaxID=1808958 RepID=A0AAW0EZ79_9TRYP
MPVTSSFSSSNDAPPVFTVHSVVQGLASDSALLLSLVITVERTATPEQRAAFVRHFVSLLLLCHDDGVFAGSELLGELFLLELDTAMWKQRDAALFMRRSSTIVSALLDQLARETFASPEGNLLPHLVAATRLLSAGDDTSASSVPTPRGASPGGWSRHSEESDPLTHPGITESVNVYDRFSTSELAGLAAAEQQFLTDTEHTPRLFPSFPSSVAGRTGMEGSRPPLLRLSKPQHLHRPMAMSQPLPTQLHPYRPQLDSDSTDRSRSHIDHTAGWQDSFRLTRDTDASTEQTAGRERGTPARVAFTAAQTRDAVDYFAEAATAAATAAAPEQHAGGHREPALGVVDVRAEALLSLALEIQDVVARHISECPLVLRRAFWLWLRASSGRSGPPESGEVSPVVHSTTAASSMSDNGAASQPLMASFEFVGMATMVVVHMLTPLLLSIPSFVLPVEEDEGSDAYATTTRRFRCVVSVLQRAAYGLHFDEKREAGLVPLNRGMRELHRRWVSCFSALADYRSGSSMNWCCPLPSPLRGLSASSKAEEQIVLLRYFEFLDGFLVPYLQTTILLRRFTEPIHLPQWLRCTYFAERFVRGQTGSAGGSAAALPRFDYAPNVTIADVAAAAAGAVAAAAGAAESPDAAEVARQRWMQLAVSRVVDGLESLERRQSSSETATAVSAFTANFISFLGDNADGVTTLLITEDLLRWFFAQEAPQYVTVREEAAAVVAFYVYLAVQHNVAEPSFQLVLIPRVSCVHRPSTPDGQSYLFTTADTLAWLRSVLEELPHSYRQRCTAVWTTRIANEAADTIPADALLSTRAADMPPLRVCHSLSSLLSTVMENLPSYIPLNTDDYHWMVCEQQQEQQQEQPRQSAPQTLHHPCASAVAPAASVHVDPTGKLSCVGDAEEPYTATPPLPPSRISVAPSLARATSGTLGSLRVRWRRPLAASESLRVGGILPLHSTRGLFEMLCTITCRRLWTDGSLQPIAGVGSRAMLTAPLTAILRLYATAADVAAALLVAVDATPPPRWLRELQFSNGRVVVHMHPSQGTPQCGVPTSPSATSLAAAQADEVRWPRCGWFHHTSASSLAALSTPSAALTLQWESLMQHVLFYSSEFDATVVEDGDGAHMAEQILSTRWGLSQQPLSSPASRAPGGPLRAVPSLRHFSVESLWRLFLFNVRQTCHIVRRATPRECPFCRMEVAIKDALRGSGGPVRPPATATPTAAVRPGAEPTFSSVSDRVVQAAADALRSCNPSEVTLVRLVVSVAAYIRNVFTFLTRDASPPTVSAADYETVARSGTAQLVYGTDLLSPTQERLVDLLCFDGDTLVQKAYLPYYDNCTWHPYGRLLYQC